MAEPQHSDFCLWMSATELKMILSALNAYSHNTEYAELVRRLHHQVAPREAAARADACRSAQSMAS